MNKTWYELPLGDACTLQRGFDLPKKNRFSGPIPLMSSSGTIDSVESAKISGPGVVTGRSGSIGKVHYIGKDFWPLNTTLYVKDFHGNDPRFIYYLLSSFSLDRFTSGAGIPTLNRNHIHSEIVSLPCDVAEQKRIVAILDEAFAGIDTAIANTEKNLAKARELFDSYLSAVFSYTGGTWNSQKLGELFSVRSSKRVLKSQWQKQGIPFYRGREITRLAEDGFVDNELFITETLYAEYKEKHGVPKAGDLVITAIGTIGNSYVVRDNDRFYFKDASVLWLDKKNTIDSAFVNFWLQSPAFRNQLEKDNGATVDTLTIGRLRSARINVPPAREQERIAKRLADLSHQTDKMEAIYEQKLTNLTELKQSLLQKAFSGELTADCHAVAASTVA